MLTPATPAVDRARPDTGARLGACPMAFLRFDANAFQSGEAAGARPTSC